MNIEKLKSKIIKLPKTPGVYIFRDSKDRILYVGKATNLRSRVKSYFVANKRFDLSRPKRPKGVEPQYGRPIDFAVDQIADIEVRETDSVLEALILEAALIKKYQPKYNAIGKDDKTFCYFIITKEDYPRVLIVRKTDLTKNSKSEILKRSDLSRPKRPKEVGPLSAVYGPYTSKKQMEIALKILRKIFPFHSNKQKTEKGCLDFQIGRCPGPYAGAITKEDYMKNIRGIRMILEGKKKSLVKKLEKEMRDFAKQHEFEKAAEARNKIFALKHIQDMALIASDDKFEIPASPAGRRNPKSETIRIEGYDISNISGQHATGSMVVFRNNEPDKSQYRKFRIKTIKDSDDVGMMKEVLIRRFKNNWPMPDLILLDGGVGHLGMAEKLLQELKLEIPMIAVAKGKSRKNINFQFPISNKFSISKFPNLQIFIANKNFIKRIMDEAHRFAIGYHRKLRRKEAFPQGTLQN